jgi:DNA mismatch endonuclease (patch repair protein)
LANVFSLGKAVQKKLKTTLLGGKFPEVSEARSRGMRAIRSKGNRTTERKLRALLVRHGFRGWVMHPKNLTGTPEFFFAEPRLAVFTDGCFWHGCPQCYRVPKTNRPFWERRIEMNRARDQRVNTRLTETGVRVLRFWEHELRQDPATCVQRIRSTINVELQDKDLRYVMKQRKKGKDGH